MEAIRDLAPPMKEFLLEPRGKKAYGCGTPILIPTLPTFTSLANLRAVFPLSVKMHAECPRFVLVLIHVDDIIQLLSPYQAGHRAKCLFFRSTHIDMHVLQDGEAHKVPSLECGRDCGATIKG